MNILILSLLILLILFFLYRDKITSLITKKENGVDLKQEESGQLSDTAVFNLDLSTTALGEWLSENFFGPSLTNVILWAGIGMLVLFAVVWILMMVTRFIRKENVPFATKFDFIMGTITAIIVYLLIIIIMAGGATIWGGNGNGAESSSEPIRIKLFMGKERTVTISNPQQVVKVHIKSPPRNDRVTTYIICGEITGPDWLLKMEGFPALHTVYGDNHQDWIKNLEVSKEVQHFLVEKGPYPKMDVQFTLKEDNKYEIDADKGNLCPHSQF